MNALLPLVVLLVLLVIASVVVGLVALQRTSPAARRADRHDPDTVPHDLEGLRREVQVLRRESAEALRHLHLVRYDAFTDMGGRLSWSLALVNDTGDGVVLTSIHGRSEARTYAKKVTAWACEQAMSPEETEAVASARGSRG
jgi:hypothetical protein